MILYTSAVTGHVWTVCLSTHSSHASFIEDTEMREFSVSC